MKKITLAVLALMTVGLIGSGKIFADDRASLATTDKPGVLEAASDSITATVVAIDYKTREVTLKAEDGTVETIVAGPDVARLNDVKKGDVVTVDVLEAVAVIVQSPDKTISSAEGTNSVIIRNQGKKPSGMKVDTQVVTATVVSIDAKNRTAVLKGPKGNQFKISIAPDVQNLQNVKKGDQVIVKVTRTVAVAVSKPVKK